MVWRAIQKLFGNSNSSRQPIRRARLRVEGLEDRSVPAVASGTLQGFAFVDTNRNGIKDAREQVLPGVTVKLTGTVDFAGTDINGVALTGAVAKTAVTDANGKYVFQNVMSGTYKLATAPYSGLLQGGITAPATVTITFNGTASTKNIGFFGIAPAYASLRQLLNRPISNALHFAPPGAGVTKVVDRADNAPTVKATISNVNVQPGAADTTMDLAANFTDADITNSVVQFQTNFGNINMELFDSQTPQTVANFFNYILSNRFDNTVFNRLVQGFVLQGGGFSMGTNPTTLNAVVTDPGVKNEFSASRSNLQWTIAMAKSPGNPDSATSQFFVNLGNNSANLDSQNGGFTVFGKLQGTADQAIVQTIANITPTDKGSGDPNDPFASFPLKNYSGSNFPTDATAANFVLVNDVKVIKRDEWLTYTVVSNSDASVVTPTIKDNRLKLVYGTTGTSTLVIKAIDRYGASVTQTFTVHVNATPTATDDSAKVNKASNVLIDVLANDTGETGETLTIQSVTQPTHGVAAIESGKVRYTPTASYSGSDSFTYTISDGNGATKTGTVSVLVNNLPTAATDSATVQQNSNVSVDVLANDNFAPDVGETLAIQAFTQGTHGTVASDSGNLKYTPTAGYSGTDSFTYTINDGNGGTATATVNVLVNAPPVSVNDLVNVGVDSTVLVDVLGNDTTGTDSGETLSIQSFTQPANGVVVLESGQLRYTPNNGYSGPDEFTYTVADNHGGTAVGTVGVTVAV